MSDFTDNAKDLDSYGVWVKMPPKGIQEDNAQTALTGQNAPKNTHAELLGQNTDDANGSGVIQQEKNDALAEKADADNEPKTDAHPIENGETSFESFAGSDFSDGIDFSAIEQAASAQADGEISLDDFLDDTSGFASPEKEDDIPDDAPLDIQVDFNTPEDRAVSLEDMPDDDDASDADAADNASDLLGEMPQVEIFSDDTFDEKMSAPPLVSTETTEVSLDEFSIDSDEPTAANDSEEVDLADFGIDSDADETPVTSNVKEKKLKEVIDYDLAISEDDSAPAAPVAAVTDANNQTYQDEDMTGQNESSEMNNKLLEQLVAELSELRKEMSLLKNEFAELKAHAPAGGSSEHTAPSDELDGIAPEAETAVQSENTGFFSNDDDDDTIALSGDELDNIMNTADFSDADAEDEGTDASTESDSTDDALAQTAEGAAASEVSDSNMFDITEPVFNEEAETAATKPEADASFENGLSIEENDTLEEPDLSALNEEDALPDEIAIPRVDEIAAEPQNTDDIMVESSSTDFMDSVKDTTDAQAEFSEMDDFNEPEAAGDMQEEPSAAETKIPEEEPAAPASDIQSDAALDGFPDDDEPSISDTLSKENEDYLKEDEALASNADDDFTGEEPIAPQEDITDADNSLPDDLKEDVKSVLLYMDQLLENLPEEKIAEFAKSEQFITYKKLFSELGLA